MLKFAFNAIDDGLVGQQVFAGEATRLAYMTDEAVEGRDAFLEKRAAGLVAVPVLLLIASPSRLAPAQQRTPRDSVTGPARASGWSPHVLSYGRCRCGTVGPAQRVYCSMACAMVFVSGQVSQEPHFDRSEPTTPYSRSPASPRPGTM